MVFALASTCAHVVVGSCSLEGVWRRSVALGVVLPKYGIFAPVLAGPVRCLRGAVAVRTLEAASCRRFQGQGSGSTAHLKAHFDPRLTDCLD